ncbi:MAG: B12-binding domain-containing radical SAM protein [Lachnospiraceae bacterium]|nr:B12-binding domain-containing radical SAM protein [Lachnospiraceae bacterium]
MENKFKKEKRMLLIQPTIYDNNHLLVKKNMLYFVGLTMPLLAAECGDDWDVEICIETIEDIPWDTDIDLIGIGSMGHSIIRGIEIAKKFKELGHTVVMGGYMASLVSDEVKQYCDAILIGDAEGYWQDMLNDYLNDNLKEFYSKKIETLSTPLPRYELITSKKIGDFLPVQAGRGCPNSCAFCSIACLYKGKYLRREIPEVIRDIKKVKELGFKKFLLIDDNILSDRKYTMDLCAEIKKLNMKWYSQCSIKLAEDPELLKCVADSGCICLSFGLESITETNLHKMNKSWEDPKEYGRLVKTIIDAGIDVATEMMIGLDDDTEESIKKTAQFVIDNKITAPKFYIITPIPGTPFFDEVKDSGELINDNIYEYSPSKAVKRNKQLSAEDIDRLYWWTYNEVYSIKNIFKRVIFTKSFLKHPMRSLFNFGVNMFYRYHIKHNIAPIII